MSGFLMLTASPRHRRSEPAVLPSERVDSQVKFALPALLLFASGAASLIFQVLWIRQLSLVVGVDVHAVTIAVAAFFAGLAVGGYLFGRRADSLSLPLFLYAILELGTAILGVGATIGLAHAAPLFVTLEMHVGLIAWLLPFFVVGLPAVLMGGTFPVMVRSLVPRNGSIGVAGGRLYAANTAGAIVGALLTAFLLMPALGVRGSSLAAAAIDTAAALGACALGQASRSRSIAPSVSKRAYRPEGFRLVLVLYAVAGGIALSYEVIWSQAVVQWTGTRTFAFAVVLATYLAGLVIGSAWYARRVDRSSDPWGTFGLLIALAGLIALLEIAFLGGWLPTIQVKAGTLAFAMTHYEPAAMIARFLTAAVCIVLVPTFLLGAAFPVALRLAADGSHAGRDTGTIIAANTAGGIVGTLLTGFFLVPTLGLGHSLAVMAVAASIIGAIAVTRGTSVRPRLRWATLACAVVAICVGFAISPDHLAQLLASDHNGKLLFHEDNAGGTVAVIAQQPGQNQFKRLYIQGVSNSGDSLTSLRYMRLQALLPLIIHRGEPRSALVIGLGTGITAGSLLRFSDLDHRVCAELLPGVVRAAPIFTGNYGVASDPRIDLRLSDGRRELLRHTESYDLITLEPPPPSAAGIANLYSRDFYALARSRLKPNGLLAQWLPLHTQTDEDTRSLVRSFRDVFPYATLWTTELHETLLVGSFTPIELDVNRIVTRFNRPDISSSLTEVGVSSPEALLATWVTNRAGLEQYAANTLPVTDDRPRIEYGRWPLPGEFERTLKNLMDLRTDPPLVGADAAFENSVANQRTILLSFYEAGLYAYFGDRANWEKTMAWVLHKDGDNAYFRWFVGTDTSQVRE
jgi:spermidine synthase